MIKKLLLTTSMLLLTATFLVFSQEKTDLEKNLEKLGLLSVTEQIPGIEVYMVYATPYNFMGEVLYEGLDEAYLVPEAMDKLRKAHEYLRKKTHGSTSDCL